MQSFIVLGIVPGTNIQITFAGWLCVAGVIATIPLLYRALKRLPFVNTMMVARQITKYVNQFQFQLPA